MTCVFIILILYSIGYSIGRYHIRLLRTRARQRLIKEGRYGSSDVRNFMDVRSMALADPNGSTSSSSQQTAQHLKQLRPGQLSPAGAAASVFGLPPAVGPGSDERSTASGFRSKSKTRPKTTCIRNRAETRPHPQCG